MKIYHNHNRLLTLTVRFDTAVGPRYCTGSSLLPATCDYDAGHELFARALARAEDKLSPSEGWSVYGGALIECSHREFEP